MISHAAAAWLFGDEEVVGTGRFNTRVPSGHEVDVLVLASVVVIRAAWGLRQRGLITMHLEAAEPVKRRRLLGMQIQVGDDSPVVRVHPTRDWAEPTVDGLLLGLLHGRRPKPGVLMRVAMQTPDPWSVFDRFVGGQTDLTSLGAVVAAGPGADDWLRACREEIEAAGLDRAAAEPAYRASVAEWNEFRAAERPLLDALNRVIGDAIRFSSVSNR